MLILERTIQWYEWGAGYLEFASAIAWFMGAVLAMAFLTPRESTSAGRQRTTTWVTLAAGLMLLAGSALAAVLSRNGRDGPAALDLDMVNMVATAGGALLLLALTPVAARWTRSWLGRASALAAASVPLVHGFTNPALQPVSAAVVYGTCGLWLLWQRASRNRISDADIPADALARLLGGALLTLGLGALATLWVPHTAIPAGVVAAGACATGGTLWWLYLREHTLPRVRERPGPWGVRPRWLLPAVQSAVLVAGCLAQRYAVQQAEDFAAHRLVSELRAVTTALGDRLAPPGPDVLRRNGLQALLAASPAFRAAALAPIAPDPETTAVFAVSPGQAPDFDPFTLRPRPGREAQAAVRHETMVRWTSPTRATDLIIVQLPVPGPPETDPIWHLTVAIQAEGLADVIVSHRLQVLVIVAFAALAAGIAVLATVRARNETELRLLKERAEVENHARNELLAMVSHEVRTPLQSVLGYAELAAMDALPPAAERHVRAIRGQGAALLRIVQDILDLSALRSGRLELQPEAVAPAALAAEVRQALGERARRKGLALTVTVDDTVPPVVLVDRVRLVQVLLNLLGNAIKFTVRGGVRLTIAPLAPPAAGAPVRLEFRIEDTGPGIPEPHLRRVFEPFRKLGDQTGANSGVGLGLAICEQIVASLQGRITVESREGQGTTFRVEMSLPTAPASALNDGRAVAASSGLPPEPAAGALTGLRVLLIDDHPLVRDLLRDALQRLGAHITACADGVTGLAAAAHARPDVVLLDLKLPDRTPAAMLAGLRPLGQAPHEPWIVGLSAGATEAEIQHSLEHGMNDFLLKPVAIAGLAETLRLSPAGAKITVPAEGTNHTSGLPNPRAATTDERATLMAEAAPAIVRIAHACHVGDSDRAAAEAHFLANSCVALGLDAAQRICRTIEDAAEREDLAAARDALGDLRVAIAQAHAAETPSRESAGR